MLRHSRCVLALCVLVFVLASRPVQAHKVKVYASALGHTITGRVYFPGGGRARNVVVQVFGPAGEGLGRVTTDERGEFIFEAEFGCDHRFVVDPGDGHRAAHTVKADELADDLPALGSASQPVGARAAAPPRLPSAAGAQVPDIEALAVQVKKLREQIEGYEERVRFRDIVGGIGYIFGAAGVVFYFLGCRRRRSGRNQSG